MSAARYTQFALYGALKRQRVDVRAEVRLPAVSIRSRSGWFFADIAVYAIGGELIALAECKSQVRELRGRQFENYGGSGYPYIVVGPENINQAALWLMEQIATRRGR